MHAARDAGIGCGVTVLAVALVRRPSGHREQPSFKDARLKIEVNATDGERGTSGPARP